MKIPKKIFKRIKKQGQISILIVLSFIPLFTLFAFVVNIGMLVHAKIALQNAADLAAVAGAATQARQLTAISHVNYMMRQTYKLFLARYYGLGNYLLKCFPKDGAIPSTFNGTQSGCQYPGEGVTSTNPFNFINTESNGTGDFPGAPVVCIVPEKESSVCQLAGQIQVAKPPNFPGCGASPICAVLQQAAQQIQNIQSFKCASNKFLNYEIASRWLYSVPDPDPNPNAKIIASVDGKLDGLVTGLGLVPEQILNIQRIRTLASYINQDPRVVNDSNYKSIEDNAKDYASIERTMQAFKTAYGNLNSKVFSNIEMTELLPTPPMLVLKEVKGQIDLPVVVYGEAQGGTNANGSDKDCERSLRVVSARVYFGVYKEPSPEVFYAVKLKAKARLLFNPFPLRGNPDPDGVELEAIAAAKPFGSRIGPAILPENGEGFFYEKRKVNKITDDNSQQLVTKELNIPNLYLNKLNNISFKTVGVLANLGKAFSFDFSTSGTGMANLQGVTGLGFSVYTVNSEFKTTGPIGNGLLNALLPDIDEIGKYNLAVDSEVNYNDKIKTGKTGMISLYRKKSEPFYTLWAPFKNEDDLKQSSVSVDEQLAEEFKKEITDSYSTYLTNAGGSTGIQGQSVDLANQFVENFQKYLGSLRSKKNYNIAHIVDPLSLYYFKNNKQYLQKFEGAKIVNIDSDSSEIFATSYTTHNDSDYYASGRDGYSVKLIPVKSIFQYIRDTNSIQGITH